MAFGENCGDSTRLVNMDTFGQPMANPLEAIEDKAEEDSILDDANLDVYPRKIQERIINIFLTLVFRTKTRSSRLSVSMVKFFSSYLIRKV